MISPRTRRSFATRAAAATGALFTAATLAACSAGQISQVATQEPAVNGTVATFGDVALRNVHILAAQDGDSIKAGSDVQLIFTAANQSAEHGDKLLAITSDVATVSLSGNTEIPAGGVLLIGPAEEAQEAAVTEVEAADTGTVSASLTKPISNGLTYPFTFKFEKAGEHEIQVPISAGEVPQHSSGH